MGSLSGAKMSDISFAVFPMLVGMLPLFLLRWRINILSLGDDEARTMGVNVRRLRLVVIVSATLVTSSAVAVSGTIGWVGLVIPHLSRKLVGSNFRHLMPATMLFGALFLLLVDNISRNLFAVEIPIGILTAFIGAPFFLSLIIRGTDRSWFWKYKTWAFPTPTHGVEGYQLAIPEGRLVSHCPNGTESTFPLHFKPANRFSGQGID